MCFSCRRCCGGDERYVLPALPFLPPGSAGEFQHDQQLHHVLCEEAERPAGTQGEGWLLQGEAAHSMSL